MFKSISSKQKHSAKPTPLTKSSKTVSKFPLHKIKLHKRSSRTTHSSPHGVRVTKDTKYKLDKEQFEQALLRKMVFVQSFEIYGGSQGLFDYGPMGEQLMSNIRAEWRRQFIKQERMLGFAGSTLTPETVLKASGHVDRFTDWMTTTIVPTEIGNDSIRAHSGPAQDKKKPAKNGKENKNNSSASTNVVEHLRTDKVVEEFFDKFIEDLTILQKSTGLNNDEMKQLNDAENEFKLVGGMSGLELDQIITKYKITHKGMSLTSSSPFNLMFDTLFGPSGKQKYFFRPETAQGIFVNFQRLYDQNNRQLPLSVAQIGTAYRNEISPRGTILRTREFTQAEIEHFVDPSNKFHPKFNKIRNFQANFLSAEQQTTVSDGQKDPTNVQNNEINNNGILMSFGQAVYGSQDDLTHKTTSSYTKTIHGMVDNETLGYFLFKTYSFLTSIGIHPDKIRFRQHLSTEMAHYATDCWDAEILTSHGWVECVGHADRSAYDLQVHSQATKTNLVATVTLDEPIHITKKGIFGPMDKFVGYLREGIQNKLIPSSHLPLAMNFRSSTQHSSEVLDDIYAQIQDQIASNGAVNGAANDAANDTTSPTSLSFQKYTLRLPGITDEIGQQVILPNVPADIFQVKEFTEVITTKTFTPHVIEPSFGLARILYSVLEHSYSVRENDEQRKVFKFAPKLAPYQLGIYTVASNIQGADTVVEFLEQSAIDLDLAIQIDISKASIGKKYSRWDEYGVPFAITIDSSSIIPQNLPFDASHTHTDHLPTVTIRERDSCEQIRIELASAIDTIHQLVHGKTQWGALVIKHGLLTRV